MKPAILDAISVVLAELIGIALVMFFGCMGCIPFGGESKNQLQTVLNFGFIIMTMIQVFGFISGAYLNPSVTVAAVIYKKLSIRMAFFYFIAQMIGSFIGIGLLKVVVPESLFNLNVNTTSDAGFCMTLPHSDLSDIQALIIEFFATTVLVFINLAIWDHRNEKHQDSAPIKFGFAVFVLSSTAGPLTGASMNPARSFGPAFWSGNFKQQWIYWVAPLSSAIISTYTYRGIFWRKKDDAYIACIEHPMGGTAVAPMKPSTLDAMSMVLAELIGTTLVMFFGCMGCIPYDGTTNRLQAALNVGFLVMTMIQVFGFVSGAYLNPSVTVAAVIYKKLSIRMAFFYFISQMVGCFIGVGLLKVVVPESLFNLNITSDVGFCMTVPHSDLSDTQALVIEFLATTVIVFIASAIWDHRNEKHQDSVPIKFGFAIFVLISTAGPLTGASMNPARSFGPAFWSGNFKQQWIYWIAPLSSAVISTYTYQGLFWRKKDDASIACIEKPVMELLLRANVVKV